MSSADNCSVSPLRTSESGYRFARGCCVSTDLLSFQPLKKHLPFHHRRLQAMIQDNCVSPQALCFPAVLNRTCKEIRQGWRHNRFGRTQTAA